MNELPTSLNNTPTLQPTEEQDDVLRSCVLSKETLDALEELGDVLRSIHKRMVSEGYEIVDGKIRKKIPQNVYEKI